MYKNDFNIFIHASFRNF